MMKLTDTDARIARETAYVLHNRPVCIELLNGGIKVWLKGKREAYTVPYDQLFTDGQRGSVKIPARHVSDAKLAKIVSKRTGGAVGCVQHDCAVCQAREADPRLRIADDGEAA